MTPHPEAGHHTAVDRGRRAAGEAEAIARSAFGAWPSHLRESADPPGTMARPVDGFLGGWVTGSSREADVMRDRCPARGVFAGQLPDDRPVRRVQGQGMDPRPVVNSPLGSPAAGVPLDPELRAKGHTRDGTLRVRVGPGPPPCPRCSSRPLRRPDTRLRLRNDVAEPAGKLAGDPLARPTDRHGPEEFADRGPRHERTGMAGNPLAAAPGPCSLSLGLGPLLRPRTEEERRMHNRPVQAERVAGEIVMVHAVLDTEPDARRLLGR